MPKTNKERLQDNNTALLRIKVKAENLPPAGGGGEPNIFVQLEEPTTKKGIWLQKEAEPEHYTYDEEIFIGGEWEPDGKYANIPYSFWKSSAVAIGTDIYLVGNNYETSTNTYFYKYNTLTNIYTKLANLPEAPNSTQAVAIGTNIYIYLRTNAAMYKYDTLVNTWTKLSGPSATNWSSMKCVAIGTDIYLFGGSASSGANSRKYDTVNDTWTSIANPPINIGGTSGETGAIAAVGTAVYLFKNGISIYKYDTLTNTYTSLGATSYVYNGSAVAVGTDIYVSRGNGTASFYKYDTLTDTMSNLANMSLTVSNNAIASVGDKVYIFGGDYSYRTVQVYALESKTYEQDNLVVINQGKYNSVGYEIELYSNSKDVTSPKYTFADAWYYTLEGGLETDIPTYYGNGTQWINIKNPPTEENS